jgi:hypothetical protein
LSFTFDPKLETPRRVACKVDVFISTGVHQHSFISTGAHQHSFHQHRWTISIVVCQHTRLQQDITAIRRAEKVVGRKKKRWRNLGESGFRRDAVYGFEAEAPQAGRQGKGYKFTAASMSTYVGVAEMKVQI